MKTKVSFRPAVLGIFFIGACSTVDADWPGTVVDSAGVTIVENPAEGIWNDNSAWVSCRYRLVARVAAPDRWRSEQGHSS